MKAKFLWKNVWRGTSEKENEIIIQLLLLNYSTAKIFHRPFRGAEVSKVTVYKYFRSKRDLVKEVVDLYLDGVLAAVEQLLHDDPDYFEKVKAILALKMDS